MRKLDDQTFVSGQVRPEDMPALAAAGIACIVNNRPEGEEPGQPATGDLAAAARASGIAYRVIPVRGGFSEDQVDAMREALATAGGPVLAFCKSGTRSAYLWALARARAGDDGAELLRKAADAGYDLSPIAAYLIR